MSTMKYSVLEFENENVYGLWEFADEAEAVECFFREYTELNKNFLEFFIEGCYKMYDVHAGFCRIVFKNETDKIRSLVIVGCEKGQNQAIYEKIKN